MTFELIHTSVQRGLRGGSGFATAVATRDLPVGLEGALEELSAYDFDLNRVVGADRVDWAHRIVTVQGRSSSVLSCTKPCGSDWSGRPNRIAHHIVLDASERVNAGPAWLLQNLGSTLASSDDAEIKIEERARGPVLPNDARVSARAASAWISAGFDAGWAGVVAKTILDAPLSPCYLILPADCDALALLGDVFALIAEDRRWHITFSTRFLRASTNAKCQLRCVRANAPALRKLLAEPGVRQVTVLTGASAGDSPAAEAGRNGSLVEATARASMKIEPVLRGAMSPRIGAGVSTGVGNASAARFAINDQSLSSEPDSDLNLDFADARPIASSTSTQFDFATINLPAYFLFAIAGAALLASFVLALLMAFQR